MINSSSNDYNDDDYYINIMMILDNMILLLIVILSIRYINSTLIVHLNEQYNNEIADARAKSKLNPKIVINPLRMISFCQDCPYPEDEGSIAYGILPKHLHLNEYSVTAEVVYCIPNYADYVKIVNGREFNDRIVIVNRGKGVTIHDKVFMIQSSGAVGVIVIDDGQCDEQFISCGFRAGSSSEGGIAAFDEPSLWKQITIPVILVTQRSGERLKNIMPMKIMDVPRLGLQNITILPEHNEL